MAELLRDGGTAGARPAGSLRERRRRELREQLSDRALRLFLEHGFDAVRVEDVARSVGVTKKTVFNHFPTKEALIADRWPLMRERTTARLRDSGGSVLDVAVGVLEQELDELLRPSSGPAADAPIASLTRFRDLVESTPDLLAHERGELDLLAEVVAQELGGRRGAHPARTDDAIDLIAAHAVVSLWRVFYDSLRRHLHADPPLTDPFELSRAVMGDVTAAASALRAGVG